MEYFHCWSGGKDSTASIILDRENGLPPSTILCTEVMFDKKRQISGELPEHIDFIKNKAKPLFESWGYKVEILHSKKDYLDLFYHVVKKSSVEERKGKYVGWLLGGMCSANRDLKVQPLYDYYKERGLSEDQYTQYVGIAIDEPKRLERLRGTNKVSLLEQFNYTEEMAYQLCKKYDLLSPGYEHSRRGGVLVLPEYKLSRVCTHKGETPGIVGRA